MTTTTMDKSESRHSLPVIMLSVFLLLAFINPGKAAASTYYLDNVSGSDSYDGTQQSHTTGTTGPWASIDKVNATTLAAGDSVLFKKGGTWKGHIEVSASGTAGSPIVFGSYGTGNLPVINPSRVISSGSWSGPTVSTYSIYSIDSTSSVYGHLMLVYEDGVPIQKATDANLTDGFWYLDTSAYILYYRTTDGEAVDAHTVAYINENYYGEAWDTVGIDVSGHSYITVDGLDFQDATTGVVAEQPGFDCISCSITLPASDASYPADFTFTVAAGLSITNGQMATAINVRDSGGSSIESNQVSVTGTVTYSGTTLTIHVTSSAHKTGTAGTVASGTWRIALDSTGSEHITVQNCSFDHNFGAISAFNAYGYDKVGNNNYWLVQNNYASRGATGFEWGSQWYAAAPAGHLTIQDNELVDMGTIDGTVTWSTILGHSTDEEAIGMQNASDTTVQDNYIHGGHAEGIYFYVDPYGVSSDNVTTRNFVRDNGLRGFVLQGSNQPTTVTDNNVASYNVFVRCGSANGSTAFITQGLGTTRTNYLVNNTFYGGLGMYEIYFYDRDSSVPDPMFNMVVENNIVVSSAAAIYLSEDSPVDSVGDVLTIDHNLYSLSGTNKYGKDTWYSWARWQGFGFDAHSMDATDPEFVNAGGSYALATDFRLPSTSLAVDAGTALSLGLTSDYEQTAISGNPDIGAFEAGAATSSDANLSALAISQGTLSSVFAASTTSYTASVANGVASMTVTPTVNEAHATVTVNGTAVTSGSASNSISLNVGSNAITILVTAQNGTTKTYTVTVTRAAAGSNPATYALIVNSGSGDGSYASGTSVTIVADAPVSGKSFDRWIGSTSSVASTVSATTTLTMPASAITLTATYEDAETNGGTGGGTTPTTKYSLTVSQGSGDGSYALGQTLTIKADTPASGKVFDRWTGDTQYVASVTSATTQVTMPGKAVNLTATYKDSSSAPSVSEYTLTINSGSGSGSYVVGQKVTVVANLPVNSNKVFDRWTGDTAYLTSATGITVQVTMPDKAITLTATYRDVLTNNPASTINLPDGTLIKLPDSPKVYVIVNGEKKWISTPEQFEQMGYEWIQIQTTTREILDTIQDVEDNLIRLLGDYKVYLVTNGIRHHIPNPQVFLDYGFSWDDIKNVDTAVMNKYKDTYLVRQSGNDKVYYLNPKGVRKHIPTAEIFDSYDDKWEDVQIISKTEMESYPLSDLIQPEGRNDVYLLSGNIKKLIPDAQTFAKKGYDWNRIIKVNQTEFDWYQDGGAVN